jgi:hypothetical protein
MSDLLKEKDDSVITYLLKGIQTTQALWAKWKKRGKKCKLHCGIFMDGIHRGPVKNQITLHFFSVRERKLEGEAKNKGKSFQKSFIAGLYLLYALTKKLFL